MTRITNEWRYFDDFHKVNYPWYTKSCLEWLDLGQFRDKLIFEYGVGESTEWFKRRGAICYGVDSDIEWARKALAKFETFNTEYVRAIEGDLLFDIVVIDGEWRDDCTEYALKYLKEGGLLIIDNYFQESVPPNKWDKTLELTDGMPCQLFNEPGHPDWCTAVFTKKTK